MKWISVDDRLPRPYDDVIVCDNNGIIYIAFRNIDNIWDGGDIACYDNPCFTHWMPLPDPPVD